MFYIYILYSEVAEIYYVGQTNDPDRRLDEHNNPEANGFTGRYRPWAMVLRFQVSETRGNAMIIENYLKGRKSKVCFSTPVLSSLYVSYRLIFL